MASIYREVLIQAPAEDVWAAVRDVGDVRRLFPGIVVESRLEEGARVATFANGMVLRELIVTGDDETRRFAYASVGGWASHHNASMQVLANGVGSRLVWIADVLPDDLEGFVAGLMDQGSAVMKKTLESTATRG
jgi:carbon monoxide dehydrogenase subunit G